MEQQLMISGTEGLVTKKVNALAILERAVEKGSSIEVQRQLVELIEHLMAAEAKREFAEALNRVQAGLKAIAPNAFNPNTKSKYATYEALDEVIRPIYIQNGFSLSFDTEPSPKPDEVWILCYVEHAAGHSRTYRIPMPCDGKGPKGGDVMTKTHATAAAASYGMRYLLKMIFNVAVGEDDTDGNAEGETMDNLAERLEWIADCRNKEELTKIFVAAYNLADRMGDENAKRQLVAAKNKRMAELGKNPGAR